jgi:hypothetical protein
VRRDVRPPEDFVCHPVSNARESLLQKENTLDWSPTVSPNEAAHFQLGEFGRMNLRGIYRPPGWCLFSVIEANAAKLPRIA